MRIALLSAVVLLVTGCVDTQSPRGSESVESADTVAEDLTDGSGPDSPPTDPDIEDDSTTTTTELRGEVVDISELGLGECFDQRFLPGQGVTEVAALVLVKCADPHDNEIYHAATMPHAPDAEYPGDEAIREFADESCLAEFEPFIGLQYELSVYEVAYLAPGVESWFLPDREVLCFVFNRTGASSTGTVAGDRTCTHDLGERTLGLCSGFVQDPE